MQYKRKIMLLIINYSSLKINSSNGFYLLFLDNKYLSFSKKQ